MKKLICLLLALVMVMAMTACGDENKEPYEEAVAAYNNGYYEEAAEKLAALGDYKDAASLLSSITAEKAGVSLEIANADGVTSADVKTQIEAYNYMDSTDAQVISTALVDLNTRVSGLSAASADYLTSADTQNFITSAATAHMVVSSDDSIVNIVKIEQTAYDALVAQSATSQTTLYVVVPDSI